jgi:hypothetical protein
MKTAKLPSRRQPRNRALAHAVAARKFGKRPPSARRRRASASPPGLGLLRLRQFRRTAHALPDTTSRVSGLAGVAERVELIGQFLSLALVRYRLTA